MPYAEKAQQNKSQPAANALLQPQTVSGQPTFQFADNRTDAFTHNQHQEMANNSPQVKQAAQLQAKADNYVLQRALTIGQTQVTDDKINLKGKYKKKLNRVISQEASVAHQKPHAVRAKLTEMVAAGHHNYPTMRDAIVAAIGEITGVTAAENALGAEIANYPVFNNFPQSKTWKLLMDGKHHDTKGKFGFENEKRYMSALMNAYTQMLQNLPQQLDVTGYELLHDLAVQNVEDRSGQPMQPGYRDNPHFGEGFGVDEDTWSDDGYQELRVKYNNRAENSVGRVLVDDPIEMVGPLVQNKVLRLIPLYRSQCQRFARVVLDAYHQEIAAAATADDQLNAIARCCQDLDQLHLFVDGNIRTIAFLVLNKLLLQNGLEPVVLDEPNVFDCKSVDELREAIKIGQAKFRSLKI